jgi:hypothetical protein
MHGMKEDRGPDHHPGPAPRDPPGVDLAAMGGPHLVHHFPFLAQFQNPRLQ